MLWDIPMAQKLLGDLAFDQARTFSEGSVVGND